MPEPFEIHVEPDEGFRLSTGKEWNGARIKYRPLGTTAGFRSFLLEYDREPLIVELQRICAQHEEASA